MKKRSKKQPEQAFCKAKNGEHLWKATSLQHVLGKICATRVVATLSDNGVQGHAKCKDTVDMAMGHWSSCYKWYMHFLGYNIQCKPYGAVIIDDGIIDATKSENGYVSYSAHYNKWKREYPQLKVIRSVEDMCNYCFVFANYRRYIANHLTTEMLTTSWNIATAESSLR